ncbi:MAG: carboxypeptidase-like regulatory domain-containing protein [Planctomycetota bacterium]
MSSKLLVFPLLALVGAAGCGGGPFDFASVSGVVTLDGEPLSNAIVRFIPQRSGESTLVGPTSHAVTNEEGRFRLETYQGRNGAVVGPHVVSVSTLEQRLVDPKNSDKVEIVTPERVPKRYRNPSELEFDVPSGGTDDADFELTS